MLKHNAKKSGMQLMAVLVVIVLLSLIPRLETRAADNISIEDGILKWEPVNGAVKYWINARATDNNYINFQTVVTTTTCNLKEEMSHNRECWSGDYEVKIYAESSTGLPMGNYTVYYYGYEATMSQLDGCVPRFHGTKVEWDPVEHAARYTLLVWPGMSPTSTFPIQYVFGDVLYNGETDFDISDKIEPDLYYRASLRVQAENGYIDSRTFQSEAVKGQDLIDGYCSTITLSGHVTLDNTNPVPGEVIHISDISGYSSRISSEDLEYEWLVQKDGSDSFEFITDAYWGYNVQSDDKYVRLRITAKGCKGEIVSPDIRVAKGLAINLSTFPDDTFRSYIKDNFDNNPSDDKLSANELNKIAHIDVGWKGIKSLKGIENLYNVQEVYAYHNEIKNADFSGLERLWRVDLSENEELTSVDVTANMRLSQLNIADCTKLSDIDLSGNPYITPPLLCQEKFFKKCKKLFLYLMFPFGILRFMPRKSEL